MRKYLIAASSALRSSLVKPASTYRAMEPTSRPKNNMTRLFDATMMENPVVARSTRASPSAPLRPRSLKNCHPAATPRAVVASKASLPKMAKPSMRTIPEKAVRLPRSPAATASEAASHCRTVIPAAIAIDPPANQPRTRVTGCHWTSTSRTAAAPRARNKSGRMASQETSGVMIISHLPLRHRRRRGGPAQG